LLLRLILWVHPSPWRVQMRWILRFRAPLISVRRRWLKSKDDEITIEGVEDSQARQLLTEMMILASEVAGREYGLQRALPLLAVSHGPNCLGRIATALPANSVRACWRSVAGMIRVGNGHHACSSRRFGSKDIHSDDLSPTRPLRV